LNRYPSQITVGSHWAAVRAVVRTAVRAAVVATRVAVAVPSPPLPPQPHPARCPPDAYEAEPFPPHPPPHPHPQSPPVAPPQRAQPQPADRSAVIPREGVSS
jgi:hypothetical protein